MESEKSINTLSDKDSIKKTSIAAKKSLSSSGKKDFSPVRRISPYSRDNKRVNKKAEIEEDAIKEEEEKESQAENSLLIDPPAPTPSINISPKFTRSPMPRQKDNPYLRTKVQTASGGELIIMLYEKAILNLQVANEALEEEGKDLAKASKNIQNAQEIVLELLYSLDIESGSDFAKKMAGLYAFINKELSEANIEKSNKKIGPIIQQLEVLLSAWKKAHEQLKTQDS